MCWIRFVHPLIFKISRATKDKFFNFLFFTTFVPSVKNHEYLVFRFSDNIGKSANFILWI
jgi:hypothetical protein